MERDLKLRVRKFTTVAWRQLSWLGALCWLWAFFSYSGHAAEKRDAQSVVVEVPEMSTRLIPFDDERVSLTLEYLKQHSDPTISLNDPAGARMIPKVIVLHWTGGRTVESGWHTFAPTRLKNRKYIAAAGAVNVSAHFLVGQDGSITQIMETTRVGRHTIGLNHISIGVENIGFSPGLPLTESQVRADVALVRWLHQKYGITHVIGHHEYRQMEGHPYFQEMDPSYRTTKSDPGEPFMAKVCALVGDLDLQCGLP